MMDRCYSDKRKSFRNYGGRGIDVCEEWKDVKNFNQWFKQNFENGKTLDRIDNNAGYSPSNCKFSTPSEQARNKRNNVVSVPIVEKIRRMEEEGFPQSEIADFFCVSRQVVNDIVLNKKWKF